MYACPVQYGSIVQYGLEAYRCCPQLEVSEGNRLHQPIDWTNHLSGNCI